MDVANWEDVRHIALELPEATEQPLHEMTSWRVRGKLFVWERPLRDSELEALGAEAPDGPILAARATGPDRRRGARRADRRSLAGASPKRVAKAYLEEREL